MLIDSILLNFDCNLNSTIFSELYSVLNEVDEDLAIPLFIKVEIKVFDKDPALLGNLQIDLLLLGLDLIAVYDFCTSFEKLQLI